MKLRKVLALAAAAVMAVAAFASCGVKEDLKRFKGRRLIRKAL